MLVSLRERKPASPRVKQRGGASGFAEGRAAGLAEGEARGKTEAYSDVARKLKSLGCRLQDTCDITGLSPEEINSLKYE